MIINKQKRIGNVIIFAEGENPEFEIIENIFHKFLGYSVIKSKRSDKIVVELKGHDKYSNIIILNTPTSNINSLNDVNSFFDFIFNEYALPLNIDTTNNPVYFVFDRDPYNNRKGVVEKLLTKLNNSQNDIEEQNGLLILSYPSLESFTISLFEKNSNEIKIALGKDVKGYVDSKKYRNTINEETLTRAVSIFVEFLLKNCIVESNNEVSQKLDSIGVEIFKIQDKLYSKEKLFYCVSQIVEILIDLQIIVL